MDCCGSGLATVATVETGRARATDLGAAPVLLPDGAWRLDGPECMALPTRGAAHEHDTARMPARGPTSSTPWDTSRPGGDLETDTARMPARGPTLSTTWDTSRGRLRERYFPYL